MINENRIVPVMKIDLISLYGLILKQNIDDLEALHAYTIGGQFTAGEGTYIAAQPVKSCNFSAASGTVYFVPDYAYEGFTVDGSSATVADNDVEVIADGATLYKAELADSTVTITKVGF